MLANGWAMAAERPIQAGRSWFGSWCAIALAVVCLASAFGAGCLNPLTDDQPSSRPSPGVTGPAIDVSPPPASSAGGEPGDFLVDDEGGEAAPSGPPRTEPGDAGVIELDSGADSGTSERLP
ncbi:MAG: hypothetical protein RL685_6956 [Pseudomonadota bacterium]|jgi:hypothetical protein